MSRLLVGIVAVAGLLLTSCGAGPTDAGGAGTQGFQAGDGSVTIVAQADRVAAPELAGETLAGEKVSTADFAGSVVVLNVWGSWCAPCRAEAPALVEASAQLEDVQFIGINTRDLDPAPANAFVRAFDIGYPNIYDPDGSLLLGFAQLPPKAIPSTLVIDKQGRVAARILGATTASTLTGIVEEVGR